MNLLERKEARAFSPQCEWVWRCQLIPLLDLSAVTQVAQCSRFWRSLLANNTVWERLCVRDLQPYSAKQLDEIERLLATRRKNDKHPLQYGGSHLGTLIKGLHNSFWFRRDQKSGISSRPEQRPFVPPTTTAAAAPPDCKQPDNWFCRHLLDTIQWQVCPRPALVCVRDQTGVELQQSAVHGAEESKPLYQAPTGTGVCLGESISAAKATYIATHCNSKQWSLTSVQLVQSSIGAICQHVMEEEVLESFFISVVLLTITPCVMYAIYFILEQEMYRYSWLFMLLGIAVLLPVYCMVCFQCKNMLEVIRSTLERARQTATVYYPHSLPHRWGQDETQQETLFWRLIGSFQSPRA